MAQGLLGALLMVVCPSACVIPPPLGTEGKDGGLNAPPIVVAAQDPFQLPGPIILEHSDPRRVFIDFADNDLQDTLHVRFFLDNAPDSASAPMGGGEVAVSGEVSRTHDFPVANWCAEIDATDTGVHSMDVMVADRDFLEAGDPPFRALPPGTAFTIRTWLMSCNPPQP